MQRPDVYTYEDYRSFIKDAGEWHFRDKTAPPTLQDWAEWLAYRSPRSVAMVLKGQRPPTSKLVDRVVETCRCTPTERRYLEMLVKLEQARERGKDLEPVTRELSRLNPRETFQKYLNKVAFAHISEWYFLALKQMVDTPSFREDPAWLVRRLRRKVTEAQVRRAIDTMLEIGVLTRDAAGKLTGRTTTTTTTDVPSAAIRQHHRQMANRAIDSLLEQPVEQREFCTGTMRFDPTRLGEAKEMIREFRGAFIKRFGGGAADDVAQLNMQFFFHSTTSED